MSTKKTISEKIAQLEQDVAWFNSDDFKLEDAETKYKAATKLAAEIESDLDSLKNKITVLQKDFSK